MKTSQIEEYDVVVLGSGAAGKLTSWSLAKQGMKTGVIERKYIGGSCPNIACLPSKNIIHSAKVASYFWRSEEYGITKDNCRIDMQRVRERKRKMVKDLIDLHLANYKASGAELIMGSGRFIAPKTIEVALTDGGKRVVRGRHVLIDTGNACLAHREDQDVSDMLQSLFLEEGIEIATDSQILGVEGKSGDLVRLKATRAGSEITLEGTHVLVAAGRTPNTDGIGLETAGVETTDRRFVKVNDRLQTTAPGIWAAGDCAGSPQFTHIGENDYRIVRDNILGGNRSTKGRLVPFCVFTDPEFARIGLSETEAKERKIPYRLSKIQAATILRTGTLSETKGFVKALVDLETDRILGCMAITVNAGEVIAPIQVAMMAQLPYTALRDAPFTHPTMSEGLVPLFEGVPTAPLAKTPSRKRGARLAEMKKTGARL